LFTSYILINYIKAVKHTPINMRNCQKVLSMHVKNTEKNDFVENVWPANSALFIYVSTHCVETVLNNNRYFQLTRWCRGNESSVVARGPGFNSTLRQGFLCLIVCFVAVVFISDFLSENTLFVQQFRNFFCNVNLFSILNILQDL